MFNPVARRGVHGHQHRCQRRTKHDCKSSLVDKPNEPKNITPKIAAQ